jgi:hypothetical protein
MILKLELIWLRFDWNSWAWFYVEMILGFKLELLG